MINSVLTTLPIYFMSTFRLPKWVIASLDKIRRRFLWHGQKETQGQKRPVFLANWELVTRSKQLGCLGVRGIEEANISLLLKWMWNWRPK